MFKVLVCGGRDFGDKILLTTKMNLLHLKRPIDLVIHGAQRGTDLMAQAWALENEIDYVGVPAKWRTGSEKKREGFKRNTRMLEVYQPDYVVAFPGGPGTAMMVDIARRAGLTVWEVTP